MIKLNDKLMSPEHLKMASFLQEMYGSQSVEGGEKAKLTEDRFRGLTNSPRPSTPNYDLNVSPKTVDLKQWFWESEEDNNCKAQQVKPHLYDCILMCNETSENSYWFVVNTDKISSKVGKDNKEDGKLLLSKQHEGNMTEGQLLMDVHIKNFITGKTSEIIKKNKDKFSDLVTFIGKFPPLNYNRKDLGLDDSEVLSILTFVRNH